VSIFVELASGRRDGFRESAWSVEPGHARRGDAHCDFTRRVVRVPIEATEMARVVRAHELLHRRVSPYDVAPLTLFPQCASRALECAEEFRVNLLLRRLGFDVSQLCDGSEERAGEQVGASGDWAEAVAFAAALFETGGERAFLRGLRRTQPSWIKPLGLIRRSILTLTQEMPTAVVGSTQRHDPADAPEGYRACTARVAQLLTTASMAEVPTTPESLQRFRRSLAPGGRRPPSGQFAPLRWLTTDLSIVVTPRHAHRRARPVVAGVRPGSPSRLLTDPHQRVFRTRRPNAGAIVLVDQSGSMDLDPGAIDRLVRSVPGVCVVGYSHRPGDVGHTPNAWVVAQGGRRCAATPPGNIGNGVDGPVLEWATRTRRPGERILWVTDGQVTDSNDHPQGALSAMCAGVVRRHRVEMVRTLDEALVLLAGRRRAASNRTDFGRVGRALQDS
jgi:hypothetical protein